MCVSLQYRCLCVRVPWEGQGGTLEGSASGREEKCTRLVLMTYIKETSFTRQGKQGPLPSQRASKSIWPSVCVGDFFSKQFVGTSKRWSKVGGGWWWWGWEVGGVKEVESNKVTALNFLRPKMFASASTHPLAGQGQRAGPCGPPGFQTDSLWLLAKHSLAVSVTVSQRSPRQRKQRSRRLIINAPSFISQRTKRWERKGKKKMTARHWTHAMPVNRLEWNRNRHRFRCLIDSSHLGGVNCSS